MPLLDHNSKGVAYAFLDIVLSRFAILAKILNVYANGYGEFGNCSTLR